MTIREGILLALNDKGCIYRFSLYSNGNIIDWLTDINIDSRQLMTVSKNMDSNILIYVHHLELDVNDNSYYSDRFKIFLSYLQGLERKNKIDQFLS